LQLSDNLTFVDILAQTQNNKEELSQWQEYFNWEDLGEAADYYGLLFDFTGQIRVGNDSLLWQTERVYECIERFKLRLSCHREADSLNLEFHYDPASFQEEAIQRLAEHFETLLDNVISAPEKPINTLDILSDRQRQEILVDFNDTGAFPAPESTFHSLFEAQAALTPAALALFYKEQSLTYTELNQQANQLAHHLRGLGVAPDNLVGLCFPRSCEMVVALLAILKAGGAYLPLDPNLPYERLHYMLEDSGAVAMVTTSALLSRTNTGQDTLPVVCLDTFRTAYSAENPTNLTNPSNLAYSVYTSGSSGRPKGVMIEHRSPLNLLVGLEQSVYAKLPVKKFRVSLNAPLSFDASMQQLVLLLRGHTLVIIPEEIRSDGTALLQYLQHNQVESLDCTPSQLQILLDAGLMAQPYPKVVLAAGEAIEGRMWQTLAQSQPGRFFNIYGPTECTVDATCYTIKPQDKEPSIGKPLANYQVYVLDSEMNPLPIGVAGELHVGGVGLARGYLNRPDLTSQKFVPNPFSVVPDARLYKTGDLARFRPDGKLGVFRSARPTG
jgi:amino acid adenylation domain-containing protein